MNHQYAYDVASASAAYTLPLVHDLAAMPPAEAFLRLHDVFYTALLAYADACLGWGEKRVPEPSTN